MEGSEHVQTLAAFCIFAPRHTNNELHSCLCCIAKKTIRCSYFPKLTNDELLFTSWYESARTRRVTTGTHGESSVAWPGDCTIKPKYIQEGSMRVSAHTCADQHPWTSRRTHSPNSSCDHIGTCVLHPVPRMYDHLVPCIHQSLL